MFNHARTLLMNVEGGSSPGASFPGEEMIPSDYHAIATSTVAAKIRRALFGPSPDRAMLNYRTRQIMELLHSTEMADHVLALDSRITYLPSQKKDLLELPAAVVTANNDTVASMYVTGTPTADKTGRLQKRWKISITGNHEVTVEPQVPESAAQVFTYTETDGASNWIALIGSDLRVYFTTGNVTVGSSWSVTATGVPTVDLGQVVVSLKASVTADDEKTLFGEAPAEPYATFANAWRSHEWLPYKLSGLVLAMIYRADEERSA